MRGLHEKRDKMQPNKTESTQSQEAKRHEVLCGRVGGIAQEWGSHAMRTIMAMRGKGCVRAAHSSLCKGKCA